MNVSEWMKMPRDGVIEKFGTIPGAILNGSGDTAFCYIPGTRDDRVLLVAHADTVWCNRNKEENIELSYSNGTIFSKVPHVGIGADDRAGCSIVWDLQKMGHSILVLTGEESGCRGSKWLMRSEEWAAEIEQHNFAVQFDRRGSNDLVFYEVGSPDFKRYCNSVTPYTTAQGSYTDIVELCDKICGVNMSVGYYNEHQASEHLKTAQFARTLQVAKEWLKRSNLPRFIKPPRPMCNFRSHNWDEYYEGLVERGRDSQIPTELQSQDESIVLVDEGDDEPKFIPSNSRLCLFCQESSLEEDLRQNGQRCIHCGANIA